MLKPGSIFIAFCMTVVVAAIATILVVGLGMHLPMALAGGVGGVAIISVINRLVARGGMTRPATLRFFELEERIGLIAERVLTIEPRLLRIDQAAQETARRASAPLEKEIAELGNLVRALAEQVQTHEAILEDLPSRQAAWAVQQFATMPAPPHDPEELYAPEPQPMRPAEPPPAAPPAHDPIKAKLIRRAIETDGIELHLQPVAALPQRRVIQYCAVPYMRDRDGVLLPPSDFVIDARLAGLQPALDAFVLDRGLRVARRLKARERDISLLVQLEAETLIAPTFHADIAKRLDANADLATHLVIGFSQEALYGFGNAEAEMLASFGEKSFRFALTHVRDVDLDAQSLHTLGIRFLRIASDYLTDPDLMRSSDLHPADLPGLMRRHGILLVADGADTESKVADLLDLDVRAAQGAVFGLPRPVRPEIFTGEEIPPQKPGAALVPDRGQAQKPNKPFRSIARRA